MRRCAATAATTSTPPAVSCAPTWRSADENGDALTGADRAGETFVPLHVCAGPDHALIDGALDDGAASDHRLPLGPVQVRREVFGRCPAVDARRVVGQID